MKDEHGRSDVTAELIVGGFMFLVLLVIGYFTIVLSRENIFQKTFPMEVEFRNVMGLRDGDNVIVRGMRVGKVKDLRLDGDRVHVMCALDSKIPLRKDYRISVVQTSVLGGRMLEVNAGSDDAEPLPEGLKIIGSDPYDLMAEAALTVHDIRKALSDGHVLDNLEKTMVEIRSISEKVNHGEGTIGKLVNDDTLYKDVRELVGQGKDAVASLKAAVDKANRGEGTLGKLMNDDSVYTNVLAITANLKDISQRLADGKGTIGKLLSQDDTVYKNIAEMTATLKDLLARVNRGEGTIGKLLKDDDLYQEAKGAVHEARNAIDDLRETTPVVSFTSIFLGAF